MQRKGASGLTVAARKFAARLEHVFALFPRIKELKASGITTLLVEENVPLAFATSDHAYAIPDGRLFSEGAPAELRARREIRQAYLGL